MPNMSKDSFDVLKFLPVYIIFNLMDVRGRYRCKTNDQKRKEKVCDVSCVWWFDLGSASLGKYAKPSKQEMKNTASCQQNSQPQKGGC